MSTAPSFTVEVSSDRPARKTLVIGLPHLGMASLTATDYLVTEHDGEYVGHVATGGLPAIAPFEDGSPRHHTRLYDVPDVDLTVLVGELFVPVMAAEAFVDGLLEWIDSERIDEIVLLHGVPYPHGPDEHDVFYVATPTYETDRLAESDIQPLGGGLLDGVAGELLTRGLEAPAIPMATFVTPSHPPGPDIDAALNLLDALESVYGIVVDRRRLEEIRARWRRHYAELSDRMNELAEGDESLGGYRYPEDRAYM